MPGDEDIFTHELTLIPIKVYKNHWIVITIDTRVNSITVYDSQHHKYSLIIGNIKKYLNCKYCKQLTEKQGIISKVYYYNSLYKPIDVKLFLNHLYIPLVILLFREKLQFMFIGV